MNVTVETKFYLDIFNEEDKNIVFNILKFISQVAPIQYDKDDFNKFININSKNITICSLEYIYSVCKKSSNKYCNDPFFYDNHLIIASGEQYKRIVIDIEITNDGSGFCITISNSIKILDSSIIDNNFINYIINDLRNNTLYYYIDDSIKTNIKTYQELINYTRTIFYDNIVREGSSYDFINYKKMYKS